LVSGLGELRQGLYMSGRKTACGRASRAGGCRGGMRIGGGRSDDPAHIPTPPDSPGETQPTLLAATEHAGLQALQALLAINPRLDAAGVPIDTRFYARKVNDWEGCSRALSGRLLSGLLRRLLRGLFGRAFLGAAFGCHSSLVSLGLRRWKQE